MPNAPPPWSEANVKRISSFPMMWPGPHLKRQHLTNPDKAQQSPTKRQILTTARKYRSVRRCLNLVFGGGGGAVSMLSSTLSHSHVFGCNLRDIKLKLKLSPGPGAEESGGTCPQVTWGAGCGFLKEDARVQSGHAPQIYPPLPQCWPPRVNPKPPRKTAKIYRDLVLPFIIGTVVVLFPFFPFFFACCLRTTRRFEVASKKKQPRKQNEPDFRV